MSVPDVLHDSSGGSIRMTRSELREIRDTLDSWRFWVGVAYFGLAACIIALFVLYLDQSDTKERAASAQVVDCVNLVDRAPALLGLLDSAELAIRVQIYTTEKNLQGSSPTARTEDLVGLRRALGTVHVFRKKFASETPTAEDCVMLSRKLGVYVPVKP